MEGLFDHWIRDLEEFEHIDKGDKIVQFDASKWEREQDEHNIEWIMTNCRNGCTNELISKEDAEYYYNECVKKDILYRYPEDSVTVNHYIRAFNFFKKWA